MICNREATSVEAAAAEWAGRVDFVGVAWSGDESSYRAFIDKYSLTFPQVSDTDGDVYARFDVYAQPAFVIVDPDGTAHTHLGAMERDELDQLLTATLEKS